MTWHVAYTKPRSEIRAQENLIAQGFEVFLPMCEVERSLRGKLILSSEPLFARYLFFRATQMANWAAVRSTRGVSHLLRFGACTEPVVVTNELIDLLRNMQASDQVSDHQSSRRALFTMGQNVEIKSGPFAGLSGYFQKMSSSDNGQTRALILIELLGKMQALYIPIDQLQA